VELPRLEPVASDRPPETTGRITREPVRAIRRDYRPAALEPDQADLGDLGDLGGGLSADLSR